MRTKIDSSVLLRVFEFLLIPIPSVPRLVLIFTRLQRLRSGDKTIGQYLKFVKTHVGHRGLLSPGLQLVYLGMIATTI